MTSDEVAIRAIHRRMIDAWNAGSGEAFAESFAEDADFIAFEGTHLIGRHEIAAFHQDIFDTVLRGSRLDGEVRLVRFLTPEIAVMHGTVHGLLPGRSVWTASRVSMQLFVVHKHDETWHVDAMLNARRLTLEQQAFADRYEELSTEARREVGGVVESLADHG